MWQELVETFELEDKVAEFVEATVKELVARERHDFSLRGSDRTGTSYCTNHKPHPPHVVGHYNTVRYGALEYFCLGREGEIPGQGQLYIVVTDREPGAPEYPGSARGYWFVADIGAASTE